MAYEAERAHATCQPPAGACSSQQTTCMMRLHKTAGLAQQQLDSHLNCCSCIEAVKVLGAPPGAEDEQL